MPHQAIKAPLIEPFPDAMLLHEWMIESGSLVKSGSPVCRIKWHQHTMVINAGCTGILEHQMPARSTIEAHQTLAHITTQESSSSFDKTIALPIARKVFDIESRALANLANKLSVNFEQAIDCLLHCKGRIMICGMGKSGLVGKKIAATLASTGSPSFFLHPSEALHGDIGALTPQDCFVSISYSGETDEILQLVPYLQRLEIPHICLTGKTNSTLAKLAQYVLDISVAEEASSLSVVPMASSITSMAMGDAIAATLIQCKGFNENDFAQNHPGGNLGKKLVTSVDSLMQTSNLPTANMESSIKEVLVTMSSGMFGMVVLVGESNNVMGVITDGDLRRALNKYPDHQFFNLKAKDIMTVQPKTIHKNFLLYQAEQLMMEFKITCLPVTSSGKLIGLIAKHHIK